MFRSMKIASIDILLDLATAKLAATVHTEEGRLGARCNLLRRTVGPGMPPGRHYRLRSYDA